MKLTFHQVLLTGLLFCVFITMTMNSNFLELKVSNFFLGGGVGWGEVANALRETRHETVKTVSKLGHKK